MSQLATSKESDVLQYVMLVLQHCDSFKPNYHEIAAAGGINNANNAQKRLKKIVETCGYSLVNGMVVEANSDEAEAAAAGAKRGRQSGGAILKQKRKLNTVDVDDEVQVETEESE